MVSATPNVNYVVSGVLLPLPVAGAVALELCNTFAGWGEEGGREYLASYEHLVVWARERGIVDEQVAGSIDFDDAQRIAQSLYVEARKPS